MVGGTRDLQVIPGNRLPLPRTRRYTMNNRIGKYLRKLRNTKNAVLFSMLIGSLIGVAITLLYAPQSGAQTRAQIRLRSMQLRNQAQMERVSAALAARETPAEAA